MPSLAEHYWRIVHETSELEDQRKKLSETEVRDRLLIPALPPVLALPHSIRSILAYEKARTFGDLPSSPLYILQGQNHHQGRLCIQT